MQGGPEPKSKLGYYRLLSPTAAVRVSPLCVGGMTFGTTMKQVMGEIDKKTVFEMLDYYYDHGVCIFFNFTSLINYSGKFH
jgi:hypothetical protein